MDGHKRKDQGFTLVELIVVLVILAILAAILVPSLLGYIDRAKMDQDILEGRDIVTATQAELTKLYGLNRDQSSSSVIPGHTDSYNKNKDVNASTSDFAKNILALSEKEPYILVVGLGSTGIYKDEEKENDQRKAYTIYTALYMKSKDSTPVYFYGDEWGYYYPTDKRIKVVTKKAYNKDITAANYHNRFGIYLQYYILADGEGKYDSQGEDGKKTFGISSRKNLLTDFKNQKKRRETASFFDAP